MSVKPWGREVSNHPECPSWVKLRRTQYEHMFSALPSNSDIARCSRHVSKVPRGDIIGLTCLVCSIFVWLVGPCAPLFHPVTSLAKCGYSCASTQHERGSYRQFHHNLQERRDLKPGHTCPN